MPTIEPTVRPTIHPSGPTIKPSNKPTFAPTPDPLCCAHMSYYEKSNWQNCIQAYDPSVTLATNCSTCMAYQCVDWTAGSSAMQTRENMYFNATRDKVYFAVGSYGMDSSRAVNCYRVSTDNIDRDIIMQVVDQDYSGVTNNIRIQLIPYNKETKHSSKDKTSDFDYKQHRKGMDNFSQSIMFFSGKRKQHILWEKSYYR
jgi:hypothetical protein